MFENHKKVSFNTDSESCGQTVLPDRQLLIEQKLVENAKKMPKIAKNAKNCQKSPKISENAKNTRLPKMPEIAKNPKISVLASLKPRRSIR